MNDIKNIKIAKKNKNQLSQVFIKELREKYIFVLFVCFNLKAEMFTLENSCLRMVITYVALIFKDENPTQYTNQTRKLGLFELYNYYTRSNYR